MSDLRFTGNGVMVFECDQCNLTVEGREPIRVAEYADVCSVECLSAALSLLAESLAPRAPSLVEQILRAVKEATCA